MLKLLKDVTLILDSHNHEKVLKVIGLYQYHLAPFIKSRLGAKGTMQIDKSKKH